MGWGQRSTKAVCVRDRLEDVGQLDNAAGWVRVLGFKGNFGMRSTKAVYVRDRIVDVGQIGKEAG